MFLFLLNVDNDTKRNAYTEKPAKKPFFAEKEAVFAAFAANIRIFFRYFSIFAGKMKNNHIYEDEQVRIFVISPPAQCMFGDR